MYSKQFMALYDETKILTETGTVPVPNFLIWAVPGQYQYKISLFEQFWDGTSTRFHNLSSTRTVPGQYQYIDHNFELNCSQKDLFLENS